MILIELEEAADTHKANKGVEFDSGSYGTPGVPYLLIPAKSMAALFLIIYPK